MNKILFIFFSLFFLSGNFCNGEELLKDEFIEESLKNIELEKPPANTNYNYQSCIKIPIKLKIAQKISTKKDCIYDTQPLTFYVRRNVKYNKKVIIKKDTIFTASVATYMSKGMNGIPGTIVIDNFKSQNIDINKIQGTYIKKGLSLSLLVYPIKWALTPIPGVGSLTNFILGCDASVNPNEDIIIYYYPEWSKNSAD